MARSKSLTCISRVPQFPPSLGNRSRSTNGRKNRGDEVFAIAGGRAPRACLVSPGYVPYGIGAGWKACLFDRSAETPACHQARILDRTAYGYPEPMASSHG